MEVILGNDAYIEFFKEGLHRKFICAETVGFKMTTETISVKTVGDGIWARPRGQKNSYSISVSGLIPYDESGVTAFDLMNYQRQLVGIDYRMVFNRRDGSGVELITGVALVTDSDITSPADFASGSFTLQGIGEPLFGIPPTCDAVITGVTIVDEGDKKFRVTVTSMTGGPAPRFEWGTGAVLPNREFFQTSLSATWLIILPFTTPAGIRPLRIIPVCDNGVDGTPYNTTYEVE